MKLRLLLSISLFVFALNRAEAQVRPADDFFHSGAQSYLTNNVEEARKQVDMGLKMYPDDIKLKKLDELLKQQQQQQQSQQQQNKNQQQNQSQQNQSQSKQDQQKQQDQKKQDEQKKQDQKKQDQQKQDQQKQQQQNQKHEQSKQDQKQQQPEPQKPGEMSPEEAKRMLDSEKGDEKMLPASQNKEHQRQHPLKDW